MKLVINFPTTHQEDRRTEPKAKNAEDSLREPNASRRLRSDGSRDAAALPVVAPWSPEKACPAVIEHKGNVYLKFPHTCKPDQKNLIKLEVYKELKEAASGPERYQQSSNVVDIISYKFFEASERRGDFFNSANLKRCFNRHRANLLPKNPTDLTFELDLDHLPPNFL